jgi:hypothetical protein
MVMHIRKDVNVRHYPSVLKSQAAMEYLMTYGWSILIIAVVLGSLAYLGVFNPNTYAPRASPGSCKVFKVGGNINLEGICNGELPQYVALFNGVNSQINMPNIVAINPTQAITISVWVNLASLVTGGIVEKGINAQYQLYLAGGSNMFSAVYASSLAYCQFQATAPLNSWHQYVMTYDGANIITYTDGALQNKCPLNGQITTTANPLNIGNIGAIISGDIADVQLYNSSLDANTVMALYKKGIGGAPINLQYLVGWWPLDGDANDYSGNGNNGVPTSVSYTNQWMSGYSAPSH